MKTIFFNSRSLILCGEDRPGQQDPGAVIIVDNGDESLKEAIRTIDSNENISSLYLLCSNIEDTYNRLRTLFTEVDAAGGLVRNSSRQYLMILRNGIWDLPKGKREKGESIPATAARSRGRDRNNIHRHPSAGLRYGPYLPQGRAIRAQAHALVRNGHTRTLPDQTADRRRHHGYGLGPGWETAGIRGEHLPVHKGSAEGCRPAPGLSRSYLMSVTYTSGSFISSAGGVNSFSAIFPTLPAEVTVSSYTSPLRLT